MVERKTSDGCFKIAGRCLVVLASIGLVGLGIAKVAVGAVFLHNCSIENMIPVWLIVSGFAPTLFGGFVTQHEKVLNWNIQIAGVLGFLFNVVWLFCGTIWVYPNYSKVISAHDTPSTGNSTANSTQGGCSISLVAFACSMVTFDWVCMCFWTTIVCVLIYNFVKSNQPDNDSNKPTGAQKDGQRSTGDTSESSGV